MIYDTIAYKLKRNKAVTKKAIPRNVLNVHDQNS